MSSHIRRTIGCNKGSLNQQQPRIQRALLLLRGPYQRCKRFLKQVVQYHGISRLRSSYGQTADRLLARVLQPEVGSPLNARGEAVSGFREIAVAALRATADAADDFELVAGASELDIVEELAIVALDVGFGVAFIELERRSISQSCGHDGLGGVELRAVLVVVVADHSASRTFTGRVAARQVEGVDDRGR